MDLIPDLLFVAALIAFFATSAVLIRWCDRLNRRGARQ